MIHKKLMSEDKCEIDLDFYIFQNLKSKRDCEQIDLNWKTVFFFIAYFNPACSLINCVKIKMDFYIHTHTHT